MEDEGGDKKERNVGRGLEGRRKRRRTNGRERRPKVVGKKQNGRNRIEILRGLNQTEETYSVWTKGETQRN